jgi:predicted aspartyl protease
MSRWLMLLPLILIVTGAAGGESPTTVMRNVTAAVGARNLARLPQGLLLHEARSGAATTSAVIAVDASGRVRQNTIGRNGLNEWLYDGEVLWMLDPTRTSSRRGVPARVGPALLEKTLLPVWVRSGYWASPAAPLDISAESSTKEAVTLALQLRGGSIRATVVIDRATWLPLRLTVPYERGPFVMDLSDPHRILGITLAGRVRTAYGDTKTESRLTFAAPLDDALLLRTLPRPQGTSFNDGVDAEVPVVRGAALADGRPGHPFVRPLIDGREVGPFHFDTGAQAMMIDVRIADELGMPVLGEAEAVSSDGVVRKVTVRQGKSFELGRMRIENPLYLADDLSKMSAPPGESRAGFCGYPLFVRAVFEVVDGGASIAIFDPATHRLPFGSWIDLSVRNFIPAVAAVANDRHRGSFLIDTGSDGAVTLNAAFAVKLGTIGQTREETFTGSGGSFRAAVATLPSFAFGGLRFTRPVAMIRIRGEGTEAEGVDGVIGRKLLEGTMLTFDYSRQRVSVTAIPPGL